MRLRPNLCVTSVAFAILFAAPAALAVPAFPGAEGPGAVATGGRGGKVIKVTTLAATGPGSLAAALDAAGPRTIVFTVSGVIRANLLIGSGNVTVAGQTAPGGGITIEGQLKADTSDGNMVLRHLRIRPPDRPSTISGEQYDALQLGYQDKLIIDHCSISWGVDETLDVYESNDVTVQWSTIAEAATNAGHPDGPLHNFGMIQGPDGRRIAVHHNLFVSNRNRNPAIANGPADVRNNVAYNVRHGFVHHNPASGPFNIVGNYYRQGPDDTLIPFFFDDENETPEANLRYWLAGNFIDDPDDKCNRVVDNPWTDACHPTFADITAPVSLRAPAAFDFAATVPGWVPVTTQSAADAYGLVLARAGAGPRDAVDTRFVDEVQTRKGKWGLQPGDRPADLMAGLTPGAAPPDGDNDGMPDAWESAHGLDPRKNDSAAMRPSGYTAIEEYINERADELSKAPPVSTPDAGVTDGPPGSGSSSGGGGGGGSTAKNGATSSSGGSANGESGSGDGGCSVHGLSGAEGSAALAVVALGAVLGRVAGRGRRGRRDRT